MKYENIVKGKFLERPNRFIAVADINGVTERVHVKNTGRCRELLISGAEIYLEPAANGDRKTKYSLISVLNGEQIVNIDSQSPNAVALEALTEGRIEEIGVPDFAKREVKYGSSRFDIYFEKDGRKGFIEVKGVTLKIGENAVFPDAPTERGTKHIRELIKARKEGLEAYVLFIVQMKGVKAVIPNAATDPDFAKALKEAAESGVKAIACDCTVTENEIKTDKPIPVKNIE